MNNKALMGIGITIVGVLAALAIQKYMDEAKVDDGLTARGGKMARRRR